jgi:IS1 family transposase
VTGEGVGAAKHIYHKTKLLRPNISHIYTDANSCYDVAFARLKIPEPHTMTKSQTHLIESSNSSIRDNLARFNRRTKRYSKSLEMLCITLELFIYRDFFRCAMRF